QTRALRSSTPREITADQAFQFRQAGTDKSHVRGLTQTLRTVGDLDPVLVWEATAAEGLPTGRIILLDGHHRLAAYANAKSRQQGIKAVVFQGDRTGAMLEAVKANTRESLPLTKRERMNAAWQLVRLPGRRITVLAVARAAGVGAATVDRMRKRWTVMQAAGAKVTGEWWRDQKDIEPDMKDRPEMTDAEREAAIVKLVTDIKSALGRMNRSPPKRWNVLWEHTSFEPWRSTCSAHRTNLAARRTTAPVGNP
ncbi:MAG: hypothetical protein ACKVKF_13465, partial [Rhodobacterales bacterium]